MIEVIYSETYPDHSYTSSKWEYQKVSLNERKSEAQTFAHKVHKLTLGESFKPLSEGIYCKENDNNNFG